MSILCLGGTFNPIHHGHLLCAQAAAEAMGLGRVVLMPSSRPPHKCADDSIVAPEHRLAMCRLAIAGLPHFMVDDRELRREGPSYTIDTVRELGREGFDPVLWLIGADQLMTLNTWHEPEALLREARFVVLARPGWALDWTSLPERFRRLQSGVISVPLIEISATDIRSRIASGRPIDFLTPPAVCRYIRDHGLYQSTLSVITPEDAPRPNAFVLPPS